MGSWLPWRKLASNPPGLDWPALPWQARGLYALLLGLANDGGRIPLGRLGLPSLAGGINAPWSEVHPHFDALVSAGWLEVEGSDVFLPHFADSQRAATTAERVAEFRKRMRNDLETAVKRPSNAPLPDCNESATNRELDKKEIRLDQNKTDSDVPSEPSQPALALQPQQAADTTKKPSEAQVRDQTALILFAELNQARLGAVGGSRAMEPRTAALAGLKACLAQGYSPDEIRRVIALKVAECRTDPSQAKWFTPTWFRPGNVERYLALRPQDVASTRPSGNYGRNPKPESDLEKLGRHFRERREARERGDVIDVESARMLDERRDDE